MNIEIITYYSQNANPDKAWMAQVLLPNGEFWGVYFTGNSEDVAKTKALELWERERAKFSVNNAKYVSAGEHKPVEVKKTDGRGHHFAGKVWLINVLSRDKIRVDSQQVDGYINSGEWVRGGPRSK